MGAVPVQNPICADVVRAILMDCEFAGYLDPTRLSSGETRAIAPVLYCLGLLPQLHNAMPADLI